MISLTLLSPWDGTESTIFVNPKLIIYFNQVTRKMREVERTYTIISFAAGLREESDSICVTETAEIVASKCKCAD